MLRREDLIGEFNLNLKRLQQTDECTDLPPLPNEAVSRWIVDGKLSNEQFYSPGKVIPLMMKLWLEENTQIVEAIQKRRASVRWKKWAKSNWTRIEQKEDLLWSRPRYQKDLNRMAEKWNIPKNGFADDQSEDTFMNMLRSDQNRWCIFKAEIEQIVRGHSSSNLQLGDEWTWVVERHLLSRDKGRLAAKLMANMMSLPQIEIKEDRWGKPVAVRLIIEQGTPEVVIRECKKDIKELEKELGIKTKRRENISRERKKAKRLYKKPARKITLPSDMKLRQRYKKHVEG